SRQYARGLDYARRAVAADPLREESHRTLIHLLAAAGQRSAALKQFRELEQVLRDELGRAPAAAIRELVAEIEAIGERPAPARAAPDRAAAAAEPVARRAAAPPSGTVTFLLTDVERSTALRERAGEPFKEALEQHHRI